MIATDDLLIGFVEDSKEHLGDIEESLLDIERTKDDFDEELVNSVFRAAHSIKGGAGMLGLEGIKELSTSWRTSCTWSAPGSWSLTRRRSPFCSRDSTG